MFCLGFHHSVTYGIHCRLFSRLLEKYFYSLDYFFWHQITSTVFLPVWPHCTNARWNRCRDDLNSFPLENWRRPLGHPHTTWMKTIQQDLNSNNLSLDEATDVAQNRPLWRLMSCQHLSLYIPNGACYKKHLKTGEIDFHDLFSFRITCKPDSCLHHLFPPSRDTFVISRLRSSASPLSNLTNQKVSIISKFCSQ